MSDRTPSLAPGTLWQRIRTQTQQALEYGALQPIVTERQVVEDGGVGFQVRVVSSLARKEQERKRQADKHKIAGVDQNPFLSPEDALRVGDISDTHIGVLNKFNVIDHHLLITTRRFEHQETLLGLQDFQALWTCMAEYEALGFYNGGTVAGASQPHKHLQLVPLPLSTTGPLTPIDPLIAVAETSQTLDSVPGLPFPHVFTGLNTSFRRDMVVAAGEILEHYRAMLARVGIHAIETPDEVRQSGPYNLLVTRRWMLLVPRTKECFRDISVNALGFAGSFFVRNADQLQLIIQHGPMRVLREVSS